MQLMDQRVILRLSRLKHFFRKCKHVTSIKPLELGSR
jgi:hypothetical protein